MTQPIDNMIERTDKELQLFFRQAAKKILRKLLGLAFNRGELKTCVQLMVPDFIANIPGAPQPIRGRDAWERGAQEFRKAFPDLQACIEDIFGTHERVAVRLRFRGTHRDSFQGVPPTGGSVTFTSIELYRLSGDRLAEELVAPDMNTLMRQITDPSHAP
jgi:steroid delta-isomerase-like uncharacterized protein